MRIPDRLRIGCHDVGVLLTDETVRHPDTREECAGYASVVLNRIVVGRRRFDEDMPESVIADTFLHEVAHFCSSTFGLGLTEQQVEGVSGALLAVIRDNDLDFRA